MYMIKHPCAEPGCSELVLSNKVFLCFHCLTIRCNTHKKPPFHLCSTMTREQIDSVYETKWATFLSSLYATSIATEASKLNHGQHCVVDVPVNYSAIVEADMYNGMNIHFPVTFDDGQRWLCRARQSRNDAPPPDLQAIVTASEVETMRVMKRHGLRVPDASLPSKPSSDQERAVDYFFIEFCAGSPWTTTGNPLTLANKSREQVTTFIDDLATFMILLSHRRFDSIGSLYPSDSDSPQVGPLINMEGFNRPTPPYFVGPFKTNGARYLAHIDLVLELIETEGLYVDDPMTASLVHSWARMLVCTRKELFVEEKDHFIKHADDKGDHWLTTDDRIAAVIDWEWAYVTTKAEAFAAPNAFYEEDVYIAGKNELTIEEKMLMEAYERLGRPDLASCVEHGRIYQRLHEVIGHGPPYDLVKLNALADAVCGFNPTPPVTMDQWREQATQDLMDFQTDEQLRALGKEFELSGVLAAATCKDQEASKI